MQPRFNAYKKIGIIALTLLASTLFYIGTVNAATKLYSDSLRSYINRTGNIRLSNQNYADLDLKSKKSNLYLTIYNETVSNLDSQVYNGISKVTSYPASGIKKFIEAGDTSIFIQTDNSDSNSIALKAENLTTIYNQEREFFETLANLENKTIAMELFSNGDKSDANFDLLDDLKEIEKILYDEVSGSSFGPTINLEGGFLKRASGIPNGVIDTQFQATGTTQNNSSTSNTRSSNSNTSEAVTLEDIISNNTVDNQISAEEQNICPVDPTLQSSLTNFIETQSQNTTQGENSTNQVISNTNQSSNTQTDTKTPPPPAVSNLNDSIFGTLNENPVIAFNTQKKQCPNNATFCFRTESIYNTAESYFAGDTQCLACEVSRMAAASKAIIDGNLIAKKAPGNFLEPNVCKKAAFNRLFSLRVNILPRPVLPVQDSVEQVQELSPQEIEQDAILIRSKINNDSGYTESSTGNAIDSVNGLAGVQDAQAVSQNYEEEVAKSRELIPNISQNLDSFSNLTGGLSTRIQAFTNYLLAINEIAIEMNETLALIKSKPVCQ